MVKKCTHNVHVIRKFDTNRLKKLKAQAIQFMRDGRREFGAQLAKWQDLFIEAHEDIDELAENQRSFADRVELIERQFKKLTRMPLIREKVKELSEIQQIDLKDIFAKG